MTEFDRQIEEAFEKKFDKDFIKYLKSDYGENVFSDLPDYEINDKAIHYTAGEKQGRLKVLDKIKIIASDKTVVSPNIVPGTFQLLENVKEYIDSELKKLRKS